MNLRELPTSVKLDENLSIFFTREFSLPSPEECVFSKTRPVGTIFADSKEFSVIEHDAAISEIYGGSIKGRAALSLYVNPIQARAHLRETFAVYIAKGEVWTRSLEWRLDGSFVVLLNRYYRTGFSRSCGFVDKQNITDQYVVYL